MKALFQNPKAALAYVAITMVSVTLFVGTEEDPGTLHQTVETFSDGKTSQDRTAQRKFGDPQPEQTIGKPSRRSKPKQVADEDAPVVFATDEELLDSADGFDPTPEVFGGFDAKGETGETFLSDQDDRKGEDEFGGWASGPEGNDEDE